MILKRAIIIACATLIIGCQNIELTILEPVVGNAMVYQRIAPSVINGPYQGRISVKVRIDNNRPNTINLETVRINRY